MHAKVRQEGANENGSTTWRLNVRSGNRITGETNLLTLSGRTVESKRKTLDGALTINLRTVIQARVATGPSLVSIYLYYYVVTNN